MQAYSQAYGHVTVGTSSMNRALRFYDAALAPLGLIPNYYGAYVRDPDRNKLCAVCHSIPD